MKTLFTSTFQHKIVSILVIFIMFIFVFTISSLYFLIKYVHSRKAHHIFENCNNTKYGLFYLTFYLGIRQIFLGFVHIFLEDKYSAQILSLLFIELFFLGFSIFYVNLRKNECFFKKSKQWVNIVASSLRITLISSFLIEPNFRNSR